ncbi:MAG: putative addiction module antidote protein [Deltaproteobacteria bacterium]|nr:putative addiction module antidote protein [Deltaproteobacteria bacterium]MBI4224679.1 putative addiction module antidote protein [Deltaproteobacteria bacterium]
MKTLSYKKMLMARFRKNPKEAIDYLNAALEDNDPKVFLIALRDVAEAYGGVGAVAKKARLNRVSLYRMLSENGNPEISSIDRLLKTLGLQLAVKLKEIA